MQVKKEWHSEESHPGCEAAKRRVKPEALLSEDFAERFREAFGRDMTADEREFFGLEPALSTHDECAEAAD